MGEGNDQSTPPPVIPEGALSGDKAVGETHWDFAARRYLKYFDDEQLAHALTLVLGPTRNSSHAYTNEVADEFIDFVFGNSPNGFDRDEMHRYLDEFAFFVAYFRKQEPVLSLAKRIQKLESQLLEPLLTLSRALDDHDILVEFGVDSDGLARVDPTQLREIVRSLAPLVGKHIESMRADVRPGKQPMTATKDEFLRWVFHFCQHIDPDFVPTRKFTGSNEEETKFTRAIELLAEPLFPPETKFSRNIKQLISDLNEEKRASGGG